MQTENIGILHVDYVDLFDSHIALRFGVCSVRYTELEDVSPEYEKKYCNVYLDYDDDRKDSASLAKMFFAGFDAGTKAVNPLK